MKKIICLAAFFGLLTAFPAFSETNDVVVSNVQGDVKIMRGGTAMPVKTGTTCQQGDIIQTGAECQADIVMNKLAGCRLLASTSCTVANPQKDSMQLTINNGNAVLNLAKLPKDSTFKVETPTAIASVRGTQFWGRVEPFSGSLEPFAHSKLSPADITTTTFAVREGTVEILVKSVGKTFSLNKGDALDISPQKALHNAVPSIRKALPAEMKAMEQADSIKTNP